MGWNKMNKIFAKLGPPSLALFPSLAMAAPAVADKADISALSATAGAAIASEGNSARLVRPNLAKILFIFIPSHHSTESLLQSGFVGLAGTNTDDALQFSHENFTVANFAGVSRFTDDPREGCACRCGQG